MGHERLRAKHRLPDGSPAVMVEAPRYLDRELAARMLACLFAGSPVRRGEMQIRVGLHQAVQMQFHRRLPGVPGDAEVEAYEAVLDRLAGSFFRYAWDEGEQRYRSVRRMGLGPEAATHIRIDESVMFGFDEAATALALVYGSVPQGVRVGAATCSKGLLAAARDRVLGSRRKPDPAAVAEFAALLREHVPGFEA